ncbi:hypothetical protein [Actinomycetospora aeridis]|uniref:Uncharacterized protein n=1 Tax=Actinomycetospora aeridis TaxID=3129231 RepID=A0ABU8N3S7_9PSEU
MTSEPAISVADLHHAYGSQTVLRGLVITAASWLWPQRLYATRTDR